MVSRDLNVARNLSPAVWSTGAGGQLDELSVGRAPMAFGPSLFPCEKYRSVGQALRRDTTLKSRNPMMVVTRAVVGLTAVGGNLEFIGPLRRPILFR